MAVVGGVVVPMSSAGADTTPPAITHVWQIQLENESESVTFGPSSPATYLNKTLVPEGVFLDNYYATGHESLDNYLSEMSGQLGNPDTFLDCPDYIDFVGTVSTSGIPAGTGCVFPSTVKTLPDQLTAIGKTWHGYMEDMGKTPTRETPTCGQPTATGLGLAPSTAPADPAPPGVPDDTQDATAADQYAARHNPFAYFHSLIDVPAGQSQSACQQNVVPLVQSADSSVNGLVQDLASANPPDYNWITPNLCDDGHDGQTQTSPQCAGPDVTGADPGPGGLISADRFLQTYVPKIMASAAYKEHGLIVITFDEAADSDTSSCCGELAGTGLQPVGGGGQTGALLISPLLTPHVSTCDYNHFSLLRSFEDLFGVSTGGSDGLGHLAQAGALGVSSFGPDVYGPTDTCNPPEATPEASHIVLFGLLGIGILGAMVVVGQRRGRLRARLC
jgi:phosphatidylinositol-3-phosphatase